MLVAAVLGPQQREDRELEVVRLPLEQLDDTTELPVGEAEGTVEGVFGDPGQALQSTRGPRRLRLGRKLAAAGSVG